MTHDNRPPQSSTETARDRPGALRPRASEDHAAAPVPGDVLGRYTLRALLGAGGMGQVFAAVDHALGRTVALKVLRAEDGASSRGRARLLREAQALAQLQHPNVVAIHDVGTAGSGVFLAMELIEGPTLADWLRDAPHSWRAIRDAFVSAGRGLAAAHAAGLVHRDFKPHNAIVGADRVVVVDFGLACGDAGAVEGAETAAGASDANTVPDHPYRLNQALTLTGEHVGTPSYMPPEQRAGGTVTARADQFAFCVALHEALFGWRPTERAPAQRSRRVVPRFLAAAIERGLARRPEHRWPSMEALLSAIDRRFWTRRRRRIAIAAAATAIAGIAILGFTAGQRAAARQACESGERLVAPLWDAATRGRVHDAFRRTGRGFADDAFARVDAGIGARLAGWSHAYLDNCEATHVRHAQSEAMLDLRGRCLASARTELTTLIASLGQADAAIVQRAPSAVVELADTARCSDPAALRAAIAPPPPPLAHDIDALREDAARVSALIELGKPQEAGALSRDLVARARRAGYKPMLARVLVQQARIEADAGDADPAIADLYEVAELATEVGDDDVASNALSLLQFALGDGRDRYVEADAVFHWAKAATARAGNPLLRVVGLLGNRAVVLGSRGDHAGAMTLYQNLIGLETLRRGADSVGVAWCYVSIGDELQALGRGGEAAPSYERAVAMLEKLYGPDHPLVGMALTKRVWNALEDRHYAVALPILASVGERYTRGLGPGDTHLGFVAYATAIALLGERRLPEARAALSRALAIHGALSPDGRDVAQDDDVLGDIAHAEGNLPEAHDAGQRALAIKRKVLGARHEGVGVSSRLDANHLLALGRVAEARTAIGEALEIDQAARDKDHPEIGLAQLTLGDVLAASHQPRAALAAYREALRILEHAHGAGFIGLGEPLVRLSAAVLAERDAQLAEQYATRAVALAAGGPPGAAEVAQIRLAQARWALGADRPAAIALARQARARLAALRFPSDELPRVDHWLATAR